MPRERSPRRQYGALPYRAEADDLHVLLITSRETGRWVIPKGWPMKGARPHVAAAREAYEEAGVVGPVDERPLGSFCYAKRLRSGRAVTCRVTVYPLAVEERLADWPERGQREAGWFTPEAAAGLVAEDGLAALLRRLRPDAATRPAARLHARPAPVAGPEPSGREDGDPTV